MAIPELAVGKLSKPEKPGPVLAGTRTDPSGNPVKNIILLSISDNEYGMVRPHLEFEDLPHHQLLHDPGERIEYVHFPDRGMVSLVVLANDGRSVEVGIIGREGAVGTPLAVGLSRGPYRAIVQIAGSAMRLPGVALDEILPVTPELRLALSRYILVQGLQTAQIAACNRLHDLEQRLARWLLMCQDRVDSERLPLTHDFLSQMLGAGRPSVTLAAGILERAGMIENLRGSIRILNRERMETAACECYGVIQHYNGGLGLK